MPSAALIAADPAAPVMTPFFWASLVLGVALLIWNTIEVGRNDAANVVNAVFGARILSRRWTLRVAALGVVLGATLSQGGVDAAKPGVFDARRLTFEQAAAVYVSVYIVNAMLLYGCSAFSLPISTTVTVVCSLAGAAAAMGPFGAVRGLSLLNITGSMATWALGAAGAAFLVQRGARAVVGEGWRDPAVLGRHGGWIGGGLLATPVILLLIQEPLDISRRLNADLLLRLGHATTFLGLWLASAAVIHLCLWVFKARFADRLFPAVALVGMVCMAFTFGHNDLANGAGPGACLLSLIDLRRDGGAMATFSPEALPRDALFGCGVLLVMGMMTEHAQRVTRALVRMASMGDHVKLFAPQWCIRWARKALSLGSRAPSRAPIFTKTPWGKTLHYDPLRACVILAVSASVVAAATGRGTPVSTTYVVFSAVLATGVADRVFRRGDAILKLGRAIFCVFIWFAAAAVAAVAAAMVCRTVYHLGVLGMAGVLASCLFLRQWVKDRSDAHETRLRYEAAERVNPDDYALEDEG